jgi:hypothetical protein
VRRYAPAAIRAAAEEEEAAVGLYKLNILDP